MALYKVQSPINSALQGMQNASATTAGMTKKQEVKEPKKSFGGALGSMIAGGSYGLGMADMFTGSEATKAMWGGVKGALGGGGAEAAGGIGGAAGARLEARFPKQSAAELFLWQMGERLAAPLHHLPLRNQWRMPGALPQ